MLLDENIVSSLLNLNYHISWFLSIMQMHCVIKVNKCQFLFNSNLMDVNINT